MSTQMECGTKPTRKFLAKARNFWGDRWDYSQTVYVDYTTSLDIRCPQHDLIFKQRPRIHLAGKVGCPRCRGLSCYDQASFLERAVEVWGDRWNYSNVEYRGSTQDVRIQCVEHGEFLQEPRHHLNRNVGCSPCRLRESSIPDDALLVRAKEVWGDRWDYSSVKFSGGYRGTISPSCKDHGRFTQNYDGHLRGWVGCPACRDRGRLTTEEVVQRSREVWGDRWDYERTQYERQIQKVTFTCKEHGDFEQYSDAHFRGGVGCIKCSHASTSKGEKEVLKYVLSLGVTAEENVRGLLPSSPQMEVDIWIPAERVAIEFNGVYYHSEKFRGVNAHFEKYLQCKEQGIKLIQVWEDDWNLRKGPVQQHLSQVLGRSTLPKTNARDLVVRVASTQQARDFLSAYHIQGFAGATIHLGGFTPAGELVALASFKRQQVDYVLVRYATSHNVRGGHSKLVAAFERSYAYRKLITFADLTFGDGGLYRSTGWVEDGVLKPDYSYLVRNVREHKFKYRLVKFRNDPSLQYVEGMTERKLAELNGLQRIYDAGKIRFIKPHPLGVDYVSV